MNMGFLKVQVLLVGRDVGVMWWYLMLLICQMILLGCLISVQVWKLLVIGLFRLQGLLRFCVLEQFGLWVVLQMVLGVLLMNFMMLSLLEVGQLVVVRLVFSVQKVGQMFVFVGSFMCVLILLQVKFILLLVWMWVEVQLQGELFQQGLGLEVFLVVMMSMLLLLVCVLCVLDVQYFSLWLFQLLVFWLLRLQFQWVVLGMVFVVLLNLLFQIRVQLLDGVGVEVVGVVGVGVVVVELFLLLQVVSMVVVVGSRWCQGLGMWGMVCMGFFVCCWVFECFSCVRFVGSCGISWCWFWVCVLGCCS